MNKYNNTFSALLVACAATVAAVPQVAAESALYAVAPPQDAAFVRWLDTPASHDAFGFVFDAASEKPTDFRFFPATDIDGAEVGGFFSVIEGADGSPVTIQEPGRSDPTKVHIVFVNATDAAARVVVAGKDAVVIGETAANAAGIRGVNPVKATLAVESADGAELGQVDLTLRRGQDVTIVARESGVVLVEDGFGAGPDAN